MGRFLSIRALHEEGLSKKAIARRLDVDVRTVRKYLRRIEADETEPQRSQGPGKLEPFATTIEAKVRVGLSAVQIHQDLCKQGSFDASYETANCRCSSWPCISKLHLLDASTIGRSYV